MLVFPGPAVVVGELADVMEALFAIATNIGVDREQAENARLRKAAERGGFAERLVWSGHRKQAGTYLLPLAARIAHQHVLPGAPLVASVGR